jgi:hypothetical protein
MRTRKLGPGAGLCKGATVRRVFRQHPAMYIFLVMLATLPVITGAASTDAAPAFPEKGTTAMQQNNPAPRAESKNPPSLKAPSPVRVETFTFGLG